MHAQGGTRLASSLFEFSSSILKPSSLELRTATPRMTLRYQFSLAQRKREEGSTLPGLPTALPASRWTALEIYHDRSQEIARMEKSRQFIDELTTSMVSRVMRKRKESIEGILA